MEDHPLRTISGVPKGFNNPQTFCQLFALGLRLGLFHFETEELGHLFYVHLLQEFFDGLRSNAGLYGILTVFFPDLSIFFFADEIPFLKGDIFWIEDYIGLEIKNPLKLLQSHIEEHPNLARDALQEPNGGHGCGQLYVSHSFPADLGLNHLHPALFTDDASVFHPLVFAAVALVVLYRPEYPGAKKTISLRLT